MAHAWYLTSRPTGIPTPEHFALRPVALAPLETGKVHIRNKWLSVDPYMRARMNDVESYIEPFSLDAPLSGAALGEVVDSRDPAFAPGDLVTHPFGWRDEVVASADALTRVTGTQTGLPEQVHLTTLGMTGATAYFGLLAVSEAKAGETVFVSAAAGAVGSTVVQIAHLKGMRVIASAGGEEKCALARQLGADATIDYKAPGSLTDKLAAVAPEGIDVYFDNVGGEHLDAALALANRNSRFAICGMIDMYNSSQPVALGNLFRVISARIRIRGFIVSDFDARIEEFRRDMSRWIAEGLVSGRETVSSGLASTPDAFVSLFTGKNLGKMLVRL